mmetsp:Transcript_56457/g.138721  ORF Transcript_56457/g.138721 Transcript_56457/m.138721 type:complete len:149 (+) Transcript_56457:116-562(+)
MDLSAVPLTHSFMPQELARTKADLEDARIERDNAYAKQRDCDRTVDVLQSALETATERQKQAEQSIHGDKQVIAWLNRELNEVLMRPDYAAGPLPSMPPRGSSVVFRPSAPVQRTTETQIADYGIESAPSASRVEDSFKENHSPTLRS